MDMARSPEVPQTLPKAVVVIAHRPSPSRSCRPSSPHSRHRSSLLSLLKLLSLISSTRSCRPSSLLSFVILSSPLCNSKLASLLSLVLHRSSVHSKTLTEKTPRRAKDDDEASFELQRGELRTTKESRDEGRQLRVEEMRDDSFGRESKDER
ncbi:hypothetical protein Sjap_026113 [Stephania japonica]|uniref:Uncharacterized protein n=1 Tax=Stephania japonica TaxID=461633 RepID=A0AAP0E6E7_9MAGN